MAEDGMSIVPYRPSSNLDVVLRHNDSVVVLDRDSQQLVLRNAAQADNGLELTECPYCRRPMHESDPRGESSHNVSPGAQPEFVNPDYFRLLHRSLPSSTDSSCPPSPRRSLVQPALPDGLTSDPGYSGDTPATHGISSAAFSQNYFKKFFVEESQLGKGGKGVVLLVKHVLDGVSLGHYACKRVPVGDDHEWLEKVLGEVQLLQHLSHPNLVSYRHVWLENARFSTFGPSVPCAFILQQYCNAGDLHTYVCGSMQASVTKQQLKERLRRKSRGEPELGEDELRSPRMLQLEEIYSFFKDITSGLRYLHANGYIHRDLKPSNCLLHQTSDGLRVLVSDFGEVQSQDSIRKSTGSTGTVSYCAPEVLRRAYPEGPLENFSFKSDIFSLGMILYFLCFAQLPYRNADIINEEKEDLDRLREEVSQWNGLGDTSLMRSDLPERLYIFLTRLLAVDPSQRPSADEVLNGIQAGVNGKEKFRFKKSGSIGNTSPQIHVYDSPPSSPVSRNQLPPRAGFSQSPVAFRRRSVYDSDNSNPDLSSTDDKRAETEHALGPGRNLVRRRRYSNTALPSPFRRGSHQDQFNESENVDRRPLLPPPRPPSRFSVGIAKIVSLWDSAFPFANFVFFFFKVVSVFQPCSPLAADPWVFYPLLLLASVSLLSPSIRIQVISVALHLLVVSLSVRSGVLCIWNYQRATAYGV